MCVCVCVCVRAVEEGLGLFGVKAQQSPLVPGVQLRTPLTFLLLRFVCTTVKKGGKESVSV